MLLKEGSNGEDVKKLQTKLGINADGTFGAKTTEAVKSFQTKNGLTPDGIVGPKTWETIMGKNILVDTPQVAPQAAPQVGGLNLDKLKGHIPDAVISQIPETASKFKIDTALKLAHFLAQCGHESGGFKVVNENLNYSADGLKKIVPKYFPGNLAESFARNPEKIAAKVYGGRMGNGDESSKEGWKFRGRGYIQLTGKHNYTEFGKAINEDITSNPDVVATKYPLLSAAWFFHKNCLHKCVDASDACVTSVTKCVNGGTIGLPDRLKHFKEYYNLLK